MEQTWRRCRAQLLIWAFCLLLPAAWADDGVYFGKFDPVFSSQIDAALKAREKFGLEKIVLIPDPQYVGKAPLEERLKLLQLAADGNPSLITPSLSELKALQQGIDKQLWKQFWEKYSPREGLLRPLQTLPSTSHVPTKLRGTPIAVIGKLDKFDRRKPHVKVNFSPDKMQRYHEDPARNEGLLPEAAAKYVKRKGLYGHSGKRGYYGLPKPVVQLLNSEQGLNDRIQDTDEFESLEQIDLPKMLYPEEKPVFDLVHVDVPVERTTEFLTGKSLSSERVKIRGKDYVRYFIHPKSVELFEKLLGDQYSRVKQYWATPTSSHRALIAWDPNSKTPPFAPKVSLDAKIAGSIRHLSAAQVGRAAAVSRLFATISPSDLAAKGIYIIDEPYGNFLNGSDVGESERSLKHLLEGNEMVPMFSLYSKPASGPPLIVKMIEHSQKGAKTFLEKNLIKPLVDHYHFLAWEHGLVGEWHEQNTLFGIKNGFEPSEKFFYRDLGGFTVKPELRARVGKNMDFMPKEVPFADLKSERSKVVSNAVDYLLRSNFFAMQKAVQEHYPEVTQKWVKDTFNKHMAKNIERETGIKALGLRELNRAVKQELKGCRAVLSQMDLKRFQ